MKEFGCRMVREFHLYGVADTLSRNAVLAGVTSGVGLYTVTVNLVTVAHDLLAHIHGRCLFFVFVVIGGWAVGRILVGLVAGLTGVGRCCGVIGLGLSLGVGSRRLNLAIDEPVYLLTLGHGDSTFARLGLADMLHEILRAGRSQRADDGDENDGK